MGFVDAVFPVHVAEVCFFHDDSCCVTSSYWQLNGRRLFLSACYFFFFLFLFYLFLNAIKSRLYVDFPPFFHFPFFLTSLCVQLYISPSYREDTQLTFLRHDQTRRVTLSWEVRDSGLTFYTGQSLHRGHRALGAPSALLWDVRESMDRQFKTGRTISSRKCFVVLGHYDPDAKMMNDLAWIPIKFLVYMKVFSVLFAAVLR